MLQKSTTKSTIDYLRTNDSLQREVVRQLAELRNINKFDTGRVKSQRGGPGEILVKRVVD